MTNTMLRIKAELDARKITQIDFAEQIGVNSITMHRWLTGQRHPNIKMVEKMAEVLGESIQIGEGTVGKWIPFEVELPDRTILNYTCSICGRKLIGYSTKTLREVKYCHCGARMEGVEE